MKSLNRKTVSGAGNVKERVLMFGEGNFLRAFAALAIDRINKAGVYEGGITALQGTENGTSDMINAQDGLYHVIERGVEGGKEVNRATLVSAVNRCIDPYKDYKGYLATALNPDIDLIISNTTEFGICYDGTEKHQAADLHRNFPAKLTDWLYRRFCHFQGAADKGVVILPCELIDRNGDKLSEIVVRYSAEWALGEAFLRWLKEHIVFANTLVDRIVSGYPKAEADGLCERLGYQDNLIDVCEPFFLWAIEGDSRITAKVPLDKGGLNVVVTDNLEFYRTRKVRILNGSHTMSVLAGHLAGLETVEQLIKDKDFAEYLAEGLRTEIIPSMNGEGLTEYADSVKERFLNPYLNHRLLSIALNSVSKFKSRVLPSIEDYSRINKSAPNALSFALAALIAFYDKGMDTAVNDEPKYLDILKGIFRDSRDENEVASAVLGCEEFWGKDLNSAVSGLTEKVAHYLAVINADGVRAALTEVING